MARAIRTAAEVLAEHQFAEHGGWCSNQDGWALAVCAKTENEQMAEHQLEMLAEAGYSLIRMTRDEGFTVVPE